MTMTSRPKHQHEINRAMIMGGETLKRCSSERTPDQGSANPRQSDSVECTRDGLHSRVDKMQTAVFL
eukprot:1085596-Rhodomonas_salina.1